MLSLISGALGLALLLIRGPLPLLVVSLAGGLLLALAIASLALDSATFVQQGRTCMLGGGTGTGSAHVAYRYYYCAGALTVVLVQAARLRRARASSSGPG